MPFVTFQCSKEIYLSLHNHRHDASDGESYLSPNYQVVPEAYRKQGAAGASAPGSNFERGDVLPLQVLCQGSQPIKPEVFRRIDGSECLNESTSNQKLKKIKTILGRGTAPSSSSHICPNPIDIPAPLNGTA